MQKKRPDCAGKYVTEFMTQSTKETRVGFEQVLVEVLAARPPGTKDEVALDVGGRVYLPGEFATAHLSSLCRFCEVDQSCARFPEAALPIEGLHPRLEVDVEPFCAAFARKMLCARHEFAANPLVSEI